MEEIIQNYKAGNLQSPSSVSKSIRPEGWSMNDSPFRKRKSGVTWGGGNIHAANASRNTRK